MKIYFWFAVVVFVISLARPVLACGANTGRGSNTTPTATSPASSSGSSSTTGAQAAGIRR